jgi:hypothetical protein
MEHQRPSNRRHISPAWRARCGSCCNNSSRSSNRPDRRRAATNTATPGAPNATRPGHGRSLLAGAWHRGSSQTVSYSASTTTMKLTSAAATNSAKRSDRQLARRGFLAQHVSHGNQEQLRFRVAHEGVAAPVGAGALVRGSDRYGGFAAPPLAMRTLKRPSQPDEPGGGSGRRKPRGARGHRHVQRCEPDLRRLAGDTESHGDLAGQDARIRRSRRGRRDPQR